MIGIIGGTEYTGGELARILSTHPDVEIAAMTSRQNAGSKVSDVHPFLQGYEDIDFTERIGNTDDLDLVFVASPQGVVMSEVPGLLERSIKVVDLSGDYRLHDVPTYERLVRSRPYRHGEPSDGGLWPPRVLLRQDLWCGPGGHPLVLRHVCHPGLRPPAEVRSNGGGCHSRRQIRNVGGRYGPQPAHTPLHMQRVNHPLQRELPQARAKSGDGCEPLRRHTWSLSYRS